MLKSSATKLGAFAATLLFVGCNSTPRPAYADSPLLMSREPLVKSPPKLAPNRPSLGSPMALPTAKSN